MYVTELAKELLYLQKDCLGTLRKKEVLPKKDEDEAMKQYSGKIMVLRWNDVTKTKSTKIVSMLSIGSARLTGSTKVISLATNLML